MTGARAMGLLVRLYPPAFRARWGDDALSEGPALRTSADLLRTALALWVHPVMWPAASGAQRRGRAAGIAVAITACAWYLVHATAELNTPLNQSGPGRALILTGAVLIGIGLLLVAPRPALSPNVCRIVLVRAARLLSVPALLAGAVVICANGGITDVEGSPLRPLLLMTWWLALALGSAGACRVVLGLDAALATPPSRRSLRLGVGMLAAALVLLGAGLLAFVAFSAGRDASAGLAGAGLLAAAALLLPTLRDLGEVLVD